ncbi:hypothetical protein CANTEDRAFT_110487 [Yamadazyma tenuis ATCC 10573]|uniref:Uncharacterized protein n=1 Tax=Candida tenuis (strain ATCC 10573 / BCRC 21748 / CBS 615 / JCM 9827 / NBRC 10315 / NRRL Y-1498 / VKM Y-70) TaxID=590646 RepID=G3BF95_CANTC|nr:uncharacterized protein CANTEDRAFT_110487 [Yamadazyma tenuis ATCC 10573]EGV60004.1 hypothetical protein CANTEDRAFT_110487 [Yamadazyma tenuis ATCC 10573]
MCISQLRHSVKHLRLQPVRYLSYSRLRHQNTQGPSFFSNTKFDFQLQDYNPDEDDTPQKIKSFYKSRPPFIQFVLKPQQLNSKITELEDILLNKSYAPVDTYKEITETNSNQVPICGSFVCFKSPINHSLHVGLVLREALSKFNNNLNRLTVLTLENTLREVHSQDVLFHCHGVLDSDWVGSLQVLENRHEEHFYSRLLVVDILKHFVNKSLDVIKTITLPTNLLDIFYAQHTSKDFLVGVCLHEVLELLKLNEETRESLNSSYFNQCCFLMAIHISMSSFHEKFIVSNNYPHLESSNIISGYSNNLVAPCHYYLLPLGLMHSLTGSVNMANNPKPFLETNRSLSELQKQQASPHRKSLQDLHFFFKFWEGKKYEYIITVMKYQLVYPNATIQQFLQKLDCFKHLPVVEQSDIMEFLVSTGIYTDDTDIFTSLNLWGGTKAVKRISTTPSDAFLVKLNPSVLALSIVGGTENTDVFKHLREQKYGPEDVIYAVPIDAENTIGVSLSKINARNYKINIHIPDLITKIAPSSDAFTKMASRRYIQSHIQFDGRAVKIFDEEIISQFKFKDRWIQGISNQFKSVADITGNQNNSQTGYMPYLTSLTLSLKFNTYDSNPFKDLTDRIEFTFDNISDVPMKSLDPTELEKVLRGKESSVLPFSLFRSKTEESPSKFGNDDYHNLGFIYNVFKTHFSVRNINGAGNINLEESVPKASFFTNELSHFVSNLTSKYCEEYNVPVFSSSQNILVDSAKTDPRADEVLVTHNNMMLPKFHANSFYQTLVSRDLHGNVSLPAYLIGKNYLSKETFGVKRSRHIPSGTDSGKVSMVTPFTSFESLLNQFQILSMINYLYKTKNYLSLKTDEYEFSRRFSYLKGLGYNLNRPLPDHVLQKYVDDLQTNKSLCQYTEAVDRKHLALKTLEKQLSEDTVNTLRLECVITSPGFEVPDVGSSIYKCFVKDLNTEVEVLSSQPATDLTIGTVLSCDRVIYFDPTTFTCVLGESSIL